jgi:peptidyl-prolyl cis-trans isomerase C
MTRSSFIAILAAVALAACSQGSKKSGPTVAKGNGIAITTEEFKAKLDEQSPFIRARYSTLERKKEFLDNLVRFEVLAKEAERQGLDKDPQVQETLRKVMVQKLVQKTFGDQSGVQSIPDADAQKYFDDHKDEFQKPKKVRLSAIVWTAPAGSPEVAKKLAVAKKLVAQVKTEEKTNTLAFGAAVAKNSEDPASKAAGGDLNFKTKDELEKAYGSELAAAVLSAKSGELAGPFATPAGVLAVKVTGIQEEINRPFDSVKSQIASRLYREKRTKEFDELVKKLKDDAKVVVDDKELDSVAVAAAPAPGVPGMGLPATGAPHGAMGMPGAMPAPVAPAKAP